eukprot:349881-Chlamydomonas_euryale.AAC.2
MRAAYPHAVRFNVHLLVTWSTAAALLFPAPLHRPTPPPSPNAGQAWKEGASPSGVARGGVRRAGPTRSRLAVTTPRAALPPPPRAGSIAREDEEEDVSMVTMMLPLPVLLSRLPLRLPLASTAATAVDAARRREASEDASGRNVMSALGRLTWAFRSSAARGVAGSSRFVAGGSRCGSSDRRARVCTCRQTPPSSQHPCTCTYIGHRTRMWD